jgi:hypothetical protein
MPAPARPPFSLSGKVALITGSSTGLGLAGAKVAMNYANNQARAEKGLHEVRAAGVSPFSAYVAAQGGQTGWSRSMARELAPTGVTVNMIAPGWIPVERHADDPQADRDAYLATVPAARWGIPEDVGWAAAHLASDEAAFVTGQTIAVNGGQTVS